MHLYPSGNHQQQGTALVVALLLLIAMTLIVLAGSRNTTMQLRIASNMESRVAAQQMAQAGLDFAQTLTAADTAGANTVCSTFNPDYSCEKNVVMKAEYGFDNSSPDGTSWLYLEADDAGLAGGCGRAMGISIETFECQFYRAFSTYDDTDNGGGRAVIGTGLMRIVPAGT